MRAYEVRNLTRLPYNEHYTNNRGDQNGRNSSLTLTLRRRQQDFPLRSDDAEVVAAQLPCSSGWLSNFLSFVADHRVPEIRSCSDTHHEHIVNKTSLYYTCCRVTDWSLIEN